MDGGDFSQKMSSLETGRCSEDKDDSETPENNSKQHADAKDTAINDKSDDKSNTDVAEADVSTPVLGPGESPSSSKPTLPPMPEFLKLQSSKKLRLSMIPEPILESTPTMDRNDSIVSMDGGSSDSESDGPVFSSSQRTLTHKKSRATLMVDRAFVIREILSSEERYCADLRKLIDDFRKPLTKMVKENKPLLTEQEITIIFQSVETIYGVDSRLLVDLEREGEEGEIGRVFAEFAPFLKIYTGYLAGVQISLETLKKVEMDPARGARFHAFYSQRTNAPSLESLFIKPVQRVPQFELLLKELRKKTTADHKDYANLLKAEELVHESALANNNFLEELQKNKQQINTIRQFPELPPNLLQESRNYSDRLRHNLLGKIPVMVLQTEPSVAFDTNCTVVNEAAEKLETQFHVQRRNTAEAANVADMPARSRRSSTVNIRPSKQSPYRQKSKQSSTSKWRMRELMVFDDLIAHKSTNDTGPDQLVEFLQYPVLLAALPEGVTSELSDISFVIQSVHGKCWVCVTLAPGGREQLVSMFADIQRKSQKHPSGNPRVARDNFLLCRQWMGRVGTVVLDTIHTEVEVLVDMARGDDGWRPFPLYHVPLLKDSKEQLPSGEDSKFIMGVVRSDRFTQGSVQLLSRPTAARLSINRSVDNGTQARVLGECVNKHKERFFQVAVFVHRTAILEGVFQASRSTLVKKVQKDLNLDSNHAEPDEAEEDGKWVTGYVRSAQLCNLYLTHQGAADPAVAAANLAPTTQTYRARLTYGLGSDRRITKLNQYRIDPDLIGEGAFSVVHLGRYQTQTGYPVAIKRLNRRKLRNKTRWMTDPKGGDKVAVLVTLLDRVREEIQLLLGLRHRKIAHLLEVVDDARCPDLFLVLEYAQHGQLMVWDKGRYSCPRPNECMGQVMRADVARWYMRDILTGVAYLHGVGVAHRDLKPENVLVYSAPAPPPKETENLYVVVAKRVIAAWRMMRVEAGFKEAGFEKVVWEVFTSAPRLPKYVNAKNTIIEGVGKECYDARKVEVQNLMTYIDQDLQKAKRALPVRPPGLGVCKLADFGVAHCFGNPKDLMPVSDVPHEVGPTVSHRRNLSLRERAVLDQQECKVNCLDGTQQFYAPECCEDDGGTDTGFSPFTADIWALGVTLLACVSGRVPFWVEPPARTPRPSDPAPPRPPRPSDPTTPGGRPILKKKASRDLRSMSMHLVDLVEQNEGDALLQRIHAVDTSQPAWQLRVVTRWTQKHVGDQTPRGTIALLDSLLLSALERDNTKRITLHELVFHPWVTFNGSFPLLGPTAMRVLPPAWRLPNSPRVKFDQHWTSVLKRIQSFLNINMKHGKRRSKALVRKHCTKVKEVYLAQVWRSFLTAEEERFLQRFLAPELGDDTVSWIRESGMEQLSLAATHTQTAAADPVQAAAATKADSPAKAANPQLSNVMHQRKANPSVGKGFKMDAKALKYGFKEGWLDSDVCWLCDRVFSTSASTIGSIFARNPKMFCRFCSRAVCKRCSTSRMHNKNATSKQKKRACDECKLAKTLGTDYFKPQQQLSRLKRNKDIASVHLSSHGFQYEALHDCINVAAAEDDVKGIFFVGFDNALCPCDTTAQMTNLRKRKEDLRAVGRRDLVDWFGGSARLAALKQLIAKDLAALDVVTVLLGTGAVEDMQILMERVGLLPPVPNAPAGSPMGMGRTRTPLKKILQTHGVAEICGAPIDSKITWFQMQKYIQECYLRLIGKPIVQSDAAIDDIFLVECQRSKVEQAQVVFNIPSDQTIVAKVATGLTNSDMKCVLDFFKRHNRGSA